MRTLPTRCSCSARWCARRRWPRPSHQWGRWRSMSVRATSTAGPVDYETAGAARARALSECGGGCRVVLTFNRCAAYAADQDAGSTAVGWAESFASSSSAQQAALSECSSRGGTGCLVRVWGCNGPVVEGGVGLDRAHASRFTGASCGRLQPWRSGRDVRPSDAGGDPGLAVVSRSSGDGLSGRGRRRSVAFGRAGSGGGAATDSRGTAAGGEFGGGARLLGSRS